MRGPSRQVAFLLLSAVVALLAFSVPADAGPSGGDSLVRTKRQYYNDDYYSSYYGWYVFFLLCQLATAGSV